MKHFILSLFFILAINTFSFSQNQNTSQVIDRAGNFYVYWGWNRAAYSRSDIRFKGADYDFTLKNVKANDRQTKFSLNPYFNPVRMTIPQYNLRLGYFITNHYNISFGTDHMKYVVQTDQVVKISGRIDGSQSVYDGNYSDEDIRLTKDFLQFEHTDGLNYLNFELRRFDEIYHIHSLIINLTEGVGAGILFPRTNTTLLKNPRYDEFHLAGYGLSAVIGLNINFYKYFFVQSEFKEGFINMPDIRTTQSSTDQASQYFFFSQLNLVFGANIAP